MEEPLSLQDELLLPAAVCKLQCERRPPENDTVDSDEEAQSQSVQDERLGRVRRVITRLDDDTQSHSLARSLAGSLAGSLTTGAVTPA